MATSLESKADIERLREIEILVGAIIRKAELRADQDLSAVEVADLAKRCDVLIKYLLQS